MVATKLFTAADLEQMGSRAEQFELVRGELAEVSPAGAELGAIGMLIGIRLGSYVLTNKIGKVFNSDTGYIIERNPDTILMPDLSVVLRNRLPKGGLWKGFVPFAPDFAVEVQSPTNTDIDLLEKVVMYLRGGSRMVWLIRPVQRTVTVFEPGEVEHVYSDADTIAGGSLFPGFSLHVAELFAQGADEA